MRSWVYARKFRSSGFSVEPLTVQQLATNKGDPHSDDCPNRRDPCFQTQKPFPLHTELSSVRSLRLKRGSVRLVLDSHRETASLSKSPSNSRETIDQFCLILILIYYTITIIYHTIPLILGSEGTLGADSTTPCLRCRLHRLQESSGSCRCIHCINAIHQPSTNTFLPFETSSYNAHIDPI